MRHEFARAANRVDVAVCVRCLYVALVTSSVNGHWVAMIPIGQQKCTIPRPRETRPGDQGDTTTTEGSRT